MLVISRKRDERVCIGDPKHPTGWVRIVDIRGDKVRLGFEFDLEVQVHRAEVARDIVAGVPRRGEGQGI